MSTEDVSTASVDKECLRVILDKAGSQSYEKMASRLKSAGPHIKFYPSQLVSFIVSDFFETYFEEDIEVLISRFFDSRAFLTTEIQKAKSPEEATEILRNVTVLLEQMKSKTRASRKTKTALKRGRKPLGASINVD